jgi:hypothetical protein
LIVKKSNTGEEEKSEREVREHPDRSRKTMRTILKKPIGLFSRFFRFCFFVDLFLLKQRMLKENE